MTRVEASQKRAAPTSQSTTPRNSKKARTAAAPASAPAATQCRRRTPVPSPTPSPATRQLPAVQPRLKGPGEHEEGYNIEVLDRGNVPAPGFQFYSRWQVMVGEELLSTRDNVLKDQPLAFSELGCWTAAVLYRFEPRRFKYIKTEGRAGYGERVERRDFGVPIDDFAELHSHVGMLKDWREAFPLTSLRLDVTIFFEETWTAAQQPQPLPEHLLPYFVRPQQSALGQYIPPPPALPPVCIQTVQHQQPPPPPPPPPEENFFASESDPNEAMRQFFRYLRTKPCFGPQNRYLKIMREELIDEDWDLDGLSEMTDQQWEKYHYGAGTLVKIRRHLGLFKRRFYKRVPSVTTQ